jgi:hypothetical protein
MLRGVFQRAAVAILLIGTLVAPAEICLQPTQKAGHACCVSMSEPGTIIHNECCAVRPTLPAIIVAPAVSGSSILIAVQEFGSSQELSSPSEPKISEVIPPQSPPTGASILRI